MSTSSPCEFLCQCDLVVVFYAPLLVGTGWVSLAGTMFQAGFSQELEANWKISMYPKSFKGKIWPNYQIKEQVRDFDDRIVS